MNSTATAPSKSNESSSNVLNPPTINPRTRLLITLILIFLPILYVAPVLLSGNSLIPANDYDQILGLRGVSGKIMSQGAIPLRNPYSLAPTSLITSIYSGTFYPLTILFGLLSPVVAINIFVISAYYLSLLGCYLFGRRIGVDNISALGVGIIFTFASCVVYPSIHIGNSATITSAAWIPWILLALENIRQQISLRWVSLGAVFIALQFFAGDFQISLDTFLLCLGYVIYYSLTQKNSKKPWIYSSIMILCGTLFSFIQIVPIRETLIQGNHLYLVRDLLPTSNVLPKLMPIIILIGIIITLSTFTALKTGNKNRSLWFWAIAGIVFLQLAGMPKEVYDKTLYWIPIYGLFQVPAINLFFASFAAAVLAGLAISSFLENSFNSSQSQRTANIVIIVLSIIVVMPAFLIQWNNRQSANRVTERLKDSPIIQFIKSREKENKQFRVIKHSISVPPALGNDRNSSTSNTSSKLRGINLDNGIFHPRISEITGDMNNNGVIQDPRLLYLNHKGVDLFGTKYLLLENKKQVNTVDEIEIENIKFNNQNIDIPLRSGSHFSFSISPSLASEIVFISNMGNSVSLPDNTLVCSVKLHTKDGRILNQNILAGRDTAEWCYDSPDISPKMRHGKPAIARSYPGEGFSSHQYIAKLPFDRTEITKIDLEYQDKLSILNINLITLYDRESGKSTPIKFLDLITNRWQKVSEIDDTAIYENRDTMPYAWFVGEAKSFDSNEVLSIVKSGTLPDGRLYNPLSTALFENEKFGAIKIQQNPIGDPSNSRINILHDEPNYIEFQTENDQPGFLVLSEPWVRGWSAIIDNHAKPVERVNYAFQGISLPSGKHLVRFVFKPRAFTNGLSYAILGILILLSTGIVSFIRKSQFPIFSEFNLWNKILITAKRLRSSSHKGIVRVIRAKLILILGIIGLIGYGYLLIARAGYGIGGADSYGYASQAKLIRHWEFVQVAHELNHLKLSDDYTDLFAPLAHFPGPRSGTTTTFYPIGLPLLVAISSAIFGWETGPFLVGPIFAILSLILIYLTAIELGLSRRLSFAGAIILGLCPTVIMHSLMLMSDVTAMCCALITVYASLRSRRHSLWALVAGIAFGMAVLVRPLNMFLIIPVLFSLRFSIKNLLYFVLGGSPLALLCLIYNYSAYGNPFLTGYKANSLVKAVLRATRAPIHFVQFTYWLSILMSPLVIPLWLGTMFNKALSHRIKCLILSWFGVYFAFYLFYDLSYDIDIEWSFTRFLLPGIPALIIGFLLTLQYMTDLLAGFAGENKTRITRLVTTSLFLIPVIGISLSQIINLNLYNHGFYQEEQKRASIWAGKIISDNSLVASCEYSGTVRYYLNQSCLRYDMLKEGNWAIVSSRLKEKGFPLHALLLQHEIELAKKNMPGKWTHLGTYNGHTSLWKITIE